MNPCYGGHRDLHWEGCCRHWPLNSITTFRLALQSVFSVQPLKLNGENLIRFPFTLLVCREGNLLYSWGGILMPLPEYTQQPPQPIECRLQFMKGFPTWFFIVAIGSKLAGSCCFYTGQIVFWFLRNQPFLRKKKSAIIFYFWSSVTWHSLTAVDIGAWKNLWPDWRLAPNDWDGVLIRKNSGKCDILFPVFWCCKAA